MSSTASMPGAQQVRTLLDGLLDKATTVERHPTPVLPGRDVHVVGAYADDEGTVRAVVLCDQTLGTVLGAALALVPPPRVQEALQAGQVPTDLADNTREVLNVGASMFNNAEAHLKLMGTWVAPEPVADPVVSFLRDPGQRADLSVEIPGYGTGTLAVILRT